MSRRTRHAALVFAVAFLAVQLIRPGRTNPPTDVSRTIEAQAGTPGGLPAILARSCGDCHSNATVWRSYTRIAPLSWAMAYAVRRGRETVNFSEWGGYSPEQQRMLLEVSCRDVSSGRMPSVYTLLRPETRLSSEDIKTICSAARVTGANAAVTRRQP
jgi:heme-binding protein